MAMNIIAATTTAATQGWPVWSDNILVDASLIPAADFLYISTDGTTPTATSFNFAVQGGQIAIVANRQPKLNSLQYAGSGGLNELPQKGGAGVTSQTVPAALYTGAGTPNTTFPTFISILASVAAAGNVGVEQR